MFCLKTRLLRSLWILSTRRSNKHAEYPASGMLEASHLLFLSSEYKIHRRYWKFGTLTILDLFDLTAYSCHRWFYFKC